MRSRTKQSSTPRPAPDALQFTSTIPARQEHVFAGLTRPDLLKLWMSLAWTGCSVTAAYFNLTVPAGEFRIESEEKSGKRHYVTGRILDVEPPRLISFTWDADWVRGEASLVTLRLAPAGGGTRLSIEHSGLGGGTQAREQHLAGWMQIGRLLAIGLPRVPAAVLQRMSAEDPHA
ncbi:MAG: SRPBCC domain-containing protein [Planctomycetota bacterium]|nr:MAG: SRPBCC domain-containing protein [Planctomycetota bacterium]